MQNLLTCKLLKSLISGVIFHINLLSNSWLKMRIAHEIFCKKENENIKGIGASKNNWQKFSGVLRKNDLWALCKTLKDNGWEVDLTLETLIKTNKRLQWRYSETSLGFQENLLIPSNFFQKTCTSEHFTNAEIKSINLIQSFSSWTSSLYSSWMGEHLHVFYRNPIKLFLF